MDNTELIRTAKPILFNSEMVHGILDHLGYSDHDNSPHCTCRSQSEIDGMHERYPDGCPVGNIPVWEEMRGDNK